MYGVEIFSLVAGSAAVAGVARRYNLSAPLVLVAAGLAASFLPQVPDYALDPHVVLNVILPPLLFAAAYQSSVVSFRQNLRPIGLLSVGLVLFTVLGVGLVASWLAPGLSLAAGLALGAIVAPPDAVAATAIGRSVGLPRRLLVILSGESLVNDATALTAYRVAVSAATAGSFSLLTGVAEFFLAAVGGVVVGYALAIGSGWLITHLRDPLLENTVLIVVPFAGYGIAESFHASGVLAVVVSGLILGHRSSRGQTYATRLQGKMIWKLIEFLLESVVFALIGLQLPEVVRGLSDRSVGELTGLTLAVFAAVVLLRFVWVYPGVYLPRLLSKRIRAREPDVPWQYPTVLGWAGMRGVVSLAAAFALPADFPERDLILFLTFAVTVGTLVLQGLTLPAVIRRLGVTQSETTADVLAEAAAQQAAATAAIDRLDALLAAETNGDGTPEVPEQIVHRLREQAEVRQLGAWERLGGGLGGPDRSVETPTAAYRRLRREMLDAERAIFVGMRDEGRIDDEVLRRVQFELDLEEAMLARE